MAGDEGAGGGQPGGPARLDRHGDSLPPGAVARLGTVRLRQDGTTSLAWLPAGDRLVASRDGRLMAWTDGRETVVVDRVRNRAVARPGGHRAKVRSLAFSPDGRRLATGSFDATALVWDLGDPALGPGGEGEGR